MRRTTILARLLPALAVAGVLGASVLASPAQIIASLTGYGYTFGGVLRGGPAASGGSANEDVFVRGQDDALWTSTVGPGNNFGGWSSLMGITVAPPGAAQESATITHAYVEGGDAKLYAKTRTSGSWGASYQQIGGVLTAGPGAASGFAAGRTDVLVRGGDKAVWWTTTADGSTYTAGGGTGGLFAAVGGVTVDSVSVTAQVGELDIYIWGQDNAIWRNSYTTALGWAGWASLGGKTIYAPASTSCSAGHQDVWVVGSDGALWSNSTITNGATWKGWVSWGGLWTSNLTAFCHPSTTNVDVFGRGSDAALWRYQVTGN